MTGLEFMGDAIGIVSVPMLVSAAVAVVKSIGEEPWDFAITGLVVLVLLSFGALLMGKTPKSVMEAAIKARVERKAERDAATQPPADRRETEMRREKATGMSSGLHLHAIAKRILASLAWNSRPQRWCVQFWPGAASRAGCSYPVEASHSGHLGNQEASRQPEGEGRPEGGP